MSAMCCYTRQLGRSSFQFFLRAPLAVSCLRGARGKDIKKKEQKEVPVAVESQE
jgi:hypothetical protein